MAEDRLRVGDSNDQAAGLVSRMTRRREGESSGQRDTQPCSITEDFIYSLVKKDRWLMIG